jgi:hypothetical protein
MFCPQCGAQQSDELKFCKLCGANLLAVRQVVATRDTGEKFDWSKTWVAEMFLSGEEQQRRKEELERKRGITPEVKRYNEIKAGVITGSVGIALMIFLYVFMQGIILSGNVTPDAAAIISRIWIAGVFPLFVGAALITNGLFVSKRIAEIARQARQTEPNYLQTGTERHVLGPADTTEFIPSGLSVTEGTTKHLGSPGQKS